MLSTSVSDGKRSDICFLSKEGIIPTKDSSCSLSQGEGGHRQTTRGSPFPRGEHTFHRSEELGTLVVQEDQEMCSFWVPKENGEMGAGEWPVFSVLFLWDCFLSSQQATLMPVFSLLFLVQRIESIPCTNSLPRSLQSGKDALVHVPRKGSSSPLLKDVSSGDHPSQSQSPYPLV